MIKNYFKNATNIKDVKLYTTSKNGSTFKYAMHLATTKTGTNIKKLIGKLIKNIMCYYPYEWNCARIDPFLTYGISISFPIIKDCKITNKDYPVFIFDCKDNVITNMKCESKSYSLECVADKFNYDEFLIPAIERKNKQFTDLLVAAVIEPNGPCKADVYYVDNKKKTLHTWEANSFAELFDRFVSANDHLKYCNGVYYEWANANTKRAYNTFIDNYDGNYFLDNAVRRGCIID